MTDDPVLLLERELVDAARRRSGDAPTAHRRRLAAPLAVAAALIPVLAVIAGVIVIRGHTSQTPAALPATPSLTQLLGVLRRPPASPLPNGLRRALSGNVATRGDSLQRVRRLQTPLYNTPSRGRTVAVDLALLRTAAGERLVVSDAPPPSRSPAPLRSEPVYFALAPAALVARRGVEALFSQNTNSGSVVVLVVPDGVARVSLAAAAQPAIEAPVADNVAALLVPGVPFIASSGSATITWYGANGRVIRRFGAPAAGSVPSSLRPLLLTLSVFRRLHAGTRLPTGVPSRLGRAHVVPPLLQTVRVGFVHRGLGPAVVHAVRLAVYCPCSGEHQGGVATFPLGGRFGPIALDPGQLSTVAELRARGEVTVVGNAGVHEVEVAVVVPNGVAWVALKVHGASPPVSHVHDNLAGFVISQAIANGYTMTWFDARARAIKQTPTL